MSLKWVKDSDRFDVAGQPGGVRHLNHTLLGVDLPIGARVVRLRFDSTEFATGTLISLVAMAPACLMIVLPIVRRRTRAEGARRDRACSSTDRPTRFLR